MNHEVEYDADFRSAAVHSRARRRIFRKTVRFDEEGLGVMLLQIIHCGVETFDVSDSEDKVALFCDADHFLRFGDGCGDGLFHEDVPVHLHEFHCRGMVFGCGNGNAESVALFRKLADGRKGFRSEFLCDGFGGFRVYIVDADEFRVRGFTVDFCMISAEDADTDDSDFDFSLAGG